MAATVSTRSRALAALAALMVTGTLLMTSLGAAGGGHAATPAPAAAAAQPNIFVYHLDDLRDVIPGSIDPLQFMPKTRGWMAQGRRYRQTFVADPSCCPSRAAMMTGRYPHNNGVLDQQDGALFDRTRNMACYLRSAGYSTYMAGKFLTTWPKSQRPPCFDHSTVMWGGYTNVAIRTDGVQGTGSGYSTTFLGNRGRQYVQDALAIGKPFLLYETPQAPHWVQVGNTHQAVPAANYASAPVGTCAGVPEPDRSDKPAYLLRFTHPTARAQNMCVSQMRAIMTADDEFDATMRLLEQRGVLANTLVILSSDNGFLWGEHNLTEKFTPYEPSIRIPLLVRWPGHITAGTDTTRFVSSLDVLPTMLEAAGFTLPAAAPRLDGESLLKATSDRTTVYTEYYVDTKANPNYPSWKMLRTGTVKYVHTYNPQGQVIAREYYNLDADQHEHTNLLGDSNPGNDPPASTINSLTTRLNALASCAGASCLR